MIISSRRGLLLGASAFLAAPAIVRASSLMPIKAPYRPIDDELADIGESLCAWVGSTDLMVSLTGHGMLAVAEHGRRERVRRGLPPEREPDPNRPRPLLRSTFLA